MNGNIHIVFVTAGRNATENLSALCSSIDTQTSHKWSHEIIDDASHLDKRYTENQIKTFSFQKRKFTINTERKFALRNIVECARQYQDDPNAIIATVDADDQLCNNDTVSELINVYKNSTIDVAWTAHTWDIKPDMNISREMPQHVNPYEWPWCSSHLRTFRASILKNISDDNFKDHNGNWFKRGYDQILMLPILKLARQRLYIDKCCYQYRIDSCSIPLVDRPGTEVEQINNIAYVRARGFIE